MDAKDYAGKDFVLPNFVDHLNNTDDCASDADGHAQYAFGRVSGL